MSTGYKGFPEITGNWISLSLSQAQHSVFPVDITSMMSIGHTAEFRKHNDAPQVIVSGFYVFSVDIIATMSTGDIALDVDLGVNILASPVYPVDIP